MNPRQIEATSAHPNAGFSMIDVLVAIIVLATALLALAALQGALTRNGADARSRSQVAAYSEGLIDALRTTGYDNITTTTIIPSNASTATTLQKAAYNVQAAAGISGLQTVVTASSFYGTNLSQGDTFTSTPPSNVASFTPRYKTLNISTTWTDATGQSRVLAMDTMVSPLTVDSGNSLDTQSLSISGATSPIVHEYNPGATAGVIPIAIGSTQQTAATNPKPELLALNGNNSAVVGTSFNVLTFKNQDSDNNTIIQQRVDTLVIGCSCKYGGDVTADDNSDFSTVTQQPYRPTYWDGTQYVAPTAVTSLTKSATGVDPSPPTTQSPYCDVCCRDRNDSSTDTVKFDPWNTTGNYSHYRYDSTNTLVAVGSSDTSHAYLNACRLIRVNGQYAVATDLNNYFFGFLATASPSPASTTAKSPIPDTTDTTDFGTGGATGSYQAFVLNYLQTNISSLENSTITIPSVSATAATYGAAPYNLDIPGNIAITYSSPTPDYRYLHARGIYVDHLETAAVTAIANAITNCTSSTSSDCFLPILPFTTINLSEIANWTDTTTSANCTASTIKTAVYPNNNAIVNEDFNASRGVVVAQSCAKASETSTVQALIGNSNSGLAATGTGFAVPIDPVDAANYQTDTQAFSIGGTASSGSGSVTATLSMTPVPTSANNVLPALYTGFGGTYPSVSWQLDSVASPSGTITNCTSNTGGTKQNPILNNYSCPSIATAAATPTSAVITVTVKNYNYAYTATGTNPCNTSKTASIQHCVNYAIDTTAILVNGAPVTAGFSSTNPAYTNDGKLAEQAVIVFPSTTLNTSNTISIGFTQPAGADTTTTYTCGSGSKPQYASCQ